MKQQNNGVTVRKLACGNSKGQNDDTHHKYVDENDRCSD